MANPSNSAKKPVKSIKGYIIEEYSIGEKWHLSEMNEKNEPWVYETEEEAEKAIKDRIEEWAEAGLEYSEDDFRVISLKEYEDKVKAVMKEHHISDQEAARVLVRPAAVRQEGQG